MKLALALLLCLCLSLGLAAAFVPPGAAVARRSRAAATTATQLSMGIGDMFKGAFENEEFKSKPAGSGLSSAPKTCMVTVNGKTVEAVAGQKLSQVCQRAGAKISYSCKNGECGTCEVLGDGKKIRVCTAVVPLTASKYTIKTFK